MKLLKVYISAFCMCSLSLLLNSCDNFLKEEPLDMKSSDQFWKTKAVLRRSRAMLARSAWVFRRCTLSA